MYSGGENPKGLDGLVHQYLSTDICDCILSGDEFGWASTISVSKKKKKEKGGWWLLRMRLSLIVSTIWYIL